MIYLTYKKIINHKSKETSPKTPKIPIMTDIEISDILADYGNYYQNRGQNMTSLLKKYYRSERVTETEMLTVMRTDNTVVELGKASIENVSQAYQQGWTPKGDVVITPQTIVLGELKIDLELYTRALKDSWLAFLDLNSLDEKSTPFIKYLMEEHIPEAYNEEFELLQVYAGAYVTPTAGVAGSPQGAMDGIRKRINQGIANGTIATISTGALSNDAAIFVKQIEDFCKQIPKKFWKYALKIALNEDKKLLYNEGRRILYNTNYAAEADLDKVQNFKHKVIGLPSMGTDDKVWTTLPGNARLYVKNASNEGQFKIKEGQPRHVQIYSQFYKGIGFADHEAVFTNDRSLV